MATEMEKWPPKWDFGHFFAIFSISVAIFRPFQAGGHFPFSFPFSLGFCAGPVSHSVDGHRTRKHCPLSSPSFCGDFLQSWCRDPHFRHQRQGSLEKGSFETGPFPGGSRDFCHSRGSSEPLECESIRRFRTSSRDSNSWRKLKFQRSPA